MATAFIYQRQYNVPGQTLQNSRAIDTYLGNPITPSYMASQAYFANQVLQFTVPNDLLESIMLIYTNNVKVQPVSNPDGIRRVNILDNGFRSMTIDIRGFFRNVTPSAQTDIINLQKFASQPQTDTYHVFGNLGLYSPNAPRFSFDAYDQVGGGPTATQGMFIENYTLGRAGMKPSIYDFSVRLVFGGIYAVP